MRLFAKKKRSHLADRPVLATPDPRFLDHHETGRTARTASKKQNEA